MVKGEEEEEEVKSGVTTAEGETRTTTVPVMVPAMVPAMVGTVGLLHPRIECDEGLRL